MLLTIRGVDLDFPRPIQLLILSNDDSQIYDIPVISNVQQDLTKWQEIHAKLVLSAVK
ncbi:hypothetical protein Lser_V15G19969 [Lactuca serriola]